MTHAGLYFMTALCPCLLGIFPYGLTAPPSFESPKDKLQSCPDDLKSTDFILPYLYQISHLGVNKNLWTTRDTRIPSVALRLVLRGCILTDMVC